ncbi:hypothetical protein ACIQU5_31975 [Streptomyces sp. NPDC090306]|uniref:hypothetical protein n=1 Tax=Streptomyces sp. NPDC090306 TaxID=3365961 RepID=UPI00380C2A06
MGADVCSVSRHNSEQDRTDDALVEELRQRLVDAARPIFEDPQFRDLILYTDGLD